MPRPREFDPDDVLDRAMDQFWTTGYEGTSVQDLVEATGLNRSSLYETFGCKHELYLAALDRYQARKAGALDEALRAEGSPLARVRAVFEGAACACQEGRGCFMVDATIERARHSDDTGRRAAHSLHRMENAFAEAVRRAREAGEVDDACDPVAAGRFLANAYRGLHVTAKLCPAPAALADVVDTTLRALSHPDMAPAA